jgi:hypothetical protein
MSQTSVARAIEARSPLDIDGTSFTISLAGYREPQPHETQQIQLAVSGVSGETRHRGLLTVAIGRFTDDEVADLAVETIRGIATGKLPPDTRELPVD